MPFPVVASVGHSQETTNTTMHDVVLPSGIVAGDLLILLLAIDRNTTLSGFPAGWTLIVSTTEGPRLRGAAYYKFATGSETNFTYTSSSAEQSSNHCLRITGAHPTTPPEGAAIDGSDASPDPPLLNPAGWDVEDTLWLASAHSDLAASTYPSGFPDNRYSASTGTTSDNAGVGYATLNSAVASQNPGTFTIDAIASWVAITIALRPTSVVSHTGAIVSPFTFGWATQGSADPTSAVSSPFTFTFTTRGTSDRVLEDPEPFPSRDLTLQPVASRDLSLSPASKDTLIITPIGDE